MKKKFIMALIFILALTVFCVVRDFVIKNIITFSASNIVGAPTRIGGFSLSIMRQSIKITNFKMYSPKGFERDIMIDIPVVYVSCDILAFMRGKIHLKELNLDLKEIGLVKNKEGRLNVDSLKITEPKDKARKPAKQMPLQIDLVRLHIVRVVNKDYSVSGPARIDVYEVGVDKAYKNITSVQQLTALIITEPLKAAGIYGLKVYGASALAGVAILPVAAVFTLTGKDYAQADYNVPWQQAYAAGLNTLKELGIIKDENKTTGVISAEIRGAEVVLKLMKLTDKKTQIRVSARKYMFPQPRIASLVMYHISNRLKK